MVREVRLAIDDSLGRIWPIERDQIDDLDEEVDWGDLAESAGAAEGIAGDDPDVPTSRAGDPPRRGKRRRRRRRRVDRRHLANADWMHDDNLTDGES